MSDTIEANSGIASYVLHWVYRPAVISRVRSAFVERYPDTWQAELASTLGDRWREAADSATSRELSKIYDVSADDEFDYLDVAHFPLLFKRHFDTLFPEVNRLSEEGYRRVRASLLLSVNEAKEARNALSHPTAAGFSVDDVLSLLVFVRRVLKHVAPDRVREVALTMRQVIDADVPAVERDALNTYLHGKPAARSPRRLLRHVIDAFQVDAMTRRVLVSDAEKMMANSEDDYFPPWMETGNIRECRRCGYQIWEFIALPDECISCHAGLAFVSSRVATRWERLVHWWKVDKRFTGHDAAAQEARLRVEDETVSRADDPDDGTGGRPN